MTNRAALRYNMGKGPGSSMVSPIFNGAKFQYVSCPGCGRKIFIARSEDNYKECRCGCRWSITRREESALVRRVLG